MIRYVPLAATKMVDLTHCTVVARTWMYLVRPQIDIKGQRPSFTTNARELVVVVINIEVNGFFSTKAKQKPSRMCISTSWCCTQKNSEERTHETKIGDMAAGSGTSV